MKLFKTELGKKVVAMALMLSIGGAVAQPQRSEAAIGGIIALTGGAGVSLMAVGGVMTAAGGLVCEVARNSDDWDYLTVAFFAGVFALIGIVILDGNGDREMVFSELAVEQALALGVSEEQARAYNGELAEINAVRESVQAEILTQAQKGEEVTAQAVSDTWQAYRAVISPEAFAALEKVSTHTAESFAKAGAAK